MTMTNLNSRGGDSIDGGGSPSNKRKSLSLPSSTLSSLLPLSSSSSPTSCGSSSSPPSSSARLHNYNHKHYSNKNIQRNYKRRPSSLLSLCHYRRVPAVARMIYLGIFFVIVRSYVSIKDNEETTAIIQLSQQQQDQYPLLKLTQLTDEKNDNYDYDNNGEQNVFDEDEKNDWFSEVQKFEEDDDNNMQQQQQPHEPSDFVQQLHQLRDELLEIASSSTITATTTKSNSRQQKLLKPPPNQTIDFQYPILLPPNIRRRNSNSNNNNNNNNSNNSPTVVILVPSYQGSFVKRQAIRETWMAAAISHNVSATILFVVGQSECDEIESDFSNDDVNSSSDNYNNNEYYNDNDNVNGYYDSTTSDKEHENQRDQHHEENNDGQDLTGVRTEVQQRLRRRRLMQESLGKQSFGNNITSVSRNATKTEAKTEAKVNAEVEVKTNTTTKKSSENNNITSVPKNVTETKAKIEAKAKANTTTKQSFENNNITSVSRNGTKTEAKSNTTTNTSSSNNDTSTSASASAGGTSSSNASNSNETTTTISLTCDQIDHNFLRLEQERYQDLLEIPMKEHYNRLPEKMIQAYNWVLNNNIGLFPNVKWIAKADDDMFVNVQNLERYLRKYNSDIPMIIGDIIYHSPVAKEGKWREDDYTKDFYPYWPKGSAGHVLSRAAAKYITETSESLHRYQGEDVNIGIWFDTARKSGHLQDVTYIHAKKLFSTSAKYSCDWNSHALIIGHDLSLDDQLECQKKQFHKNDDGEEEKWSEAAWLDIPSDFEEMIRREESSSSSYEQGGRVSI
jgi:hypothetical protein